MNKKILIGLSVLSVSAAFWACGDGDVITKGGDDELALLNYGPPFAEGDEGNMHTLVNQAMADCSADEACAAKMEGSTYEPPESSAEGGEGGEGGGETPTSSPSGPVSNGSGPVVNTSSASVTPTGSSASGGNNPPPSSATTATDANDLDGDCTPSATKISKGGTVTWTLTPAKLNTTNVTELVDYQNRVKAASCTWTIEGAAETAATGKCGDKVTSTYAKPGDYKTTVKIGDKAKTCPVVTVEGSPITGCKCTTATTNPDVASGAQTVTWTVDPTTCTTSANIASYTWTGATGTSNTATAQVSKKDEEVKPTVRVKTDEFSYVDVTCTAVKAINSEIPDYIIDEVDGTKEVPVGKCVTISGTALSSGASVRCTHSWQDPACSYTFAAGTTTVTEENEHCNISPGAALAMSAVKANNGQVCITEASGATSVVCKVTNW